MTPASAMNFLAWLMEDVNDVSAQVGTPRDSRLKEFEQQGFLKLYESRHGRHYYEITSLWMRAS